MPGLVRNPTYFTSDYSTKIQGLVMTNGTACGARTEPAGIVFQGNGDGEQVVLPFVDGNAEAFGFSQVFLVSGVGVLVPEATEENKYPRTAQLTTAQTCLIAQGYNFMSKERPDEKDIPIASVIRSALQGPVRTTPGGVFGMRFSPVEDSSIQVDVMTEDRINVGDIYKWQDEALKSMREQMVKKKRGYFL